MGRYFQDQQNGYPPEERHRTPEELERAEKEEKREKWILTENLLSFCAVVLGVVLIIVLSALLFSMTDWLKRDISANFSVLYTRFMK